jgi:hypothetical protein
MELLFIGGQFVKKQEKLVGVDAFFVGNMAKDLYGKPVIC